MKNLKQMNLKELSANELKNVEGGDWPSFSDFIDAVETAIVWYENIKRFTPII